MANSENPGLDARIFRRRNPRPTPMPIIPLYGPYGLLGRFPDQSGSMSGRSEEDAKAFCAERFFAVGDLHGGTHVEALSKLFGDMPRDPRWDRYQFVITDGPAPLLEEEGGAELLREMLKGLPPMNLVFLDTPGTVDKT